MCSHTFILFWVRKTSVNVEKYHLNFPMIFFVLFIWRPLHFFRKEFPLFIHISMLTTFLVFPLFKVYVLTCSRSSSSSQLMFFMSSLWGSVIDFNLLSGAAVLVLSVLQISSLVETSSHSLLISSASLASTSTFILFKLETYKMQHKPMITIQKTGKALFKLRLKWR